MSSHFESPRKILMLENGIAACGCLTNPGIVAFLTARPSRIAIEPGTSAGADPIELPRIAAQDVALLSKEFALVIDKEGTVWSVPLSDPTRVREIVRDMRALCSRPAGDSALSISEEGNVFVLSLGRGEVSARPVDVPGRTRAIHASDGGTSIVVEGDEGGQLRFYAGATLDRGPSSRVVLPRQAADFDQVRGGRVFSVVFKRGGTSLCVVVRDGARAEAKIIGLASAVADVAVTDASIVVAMIDGSLALYDMATIVAASEGFVAPVHTVALGSTGRPRVALAMTIKGTTSIWVGTSSGEAMRTSLVEGAVPVKTAKEEVVVTPPVNSEAVALRKELEETRSALEASTTDLQTRTNERDLLQAAFDAKVLELHTRTDELHNRTNERDQLQTSFDAKALALHTRTDELQTRTEELHNRNNELHTRMGERDQLQAALDARALELQTRTDELQTRTGERDLLQAALDAKALELQSRTDELHTRTGERDQLQAALHAKALELQSRAEELHTRADELLSRNNELHTRTGERDQLQAALDAKALELQTRTDELHKRTGERDQLQAALDAKALELQTRTEEREQLKSEVAAAEARATALETRTSELDAQLSKTRATHDAIRDELERMKTDLVRQRNEFESSRAKRIEEALPERVVDGLEILASLLGRRH